MTADTNAALRIAVLAKQVPRFEEMELGPDGRLVRNGVDVEMNPYCRRAVATGARLASGTGGRCTIFTLGPPSAEDVLREAIAWGVDDGVLITDVAFAGSDTLATARALAAALRCEGPFDLVLLGRNSVDADTGQVGPELAELMGLPFLAGARTLSIAGGRVEARLEHDDGWVVVDAGLPAVVSCAERLCDPAKVDPPGRAAVAADVLRVLRAADLGDGPWGDAGSPTKVGEVRLRIQPRDRIVLSGVLDAQVELVVDELVRRGLLHQGSSGGEQPLLAVPATAADDDRASPIAVVVEPRRAKVARELLGAAAALAHDSARSVLAVVPGTHADLALLGGWGADEVMLVEGSPAADDVASGLAPWCAARLPWAVLVPSTMWGREMAGRLAAALGAGLTGDAIDLEVAGGRLVGWKPAFGGQLVAAVTSTSAVQLVTVRPGVLDLRIPRTGLATAVATVRARATHRVRVHDSGRDDDVDILAAARVVVGVGAGVDPSGYGTVEALADVLGGTVAATRKVTDKEWMPRARQVGITGRSIQPDLYIALGISGRFNHVVGVRAARFVVAVNTDPDAPIFESCDLGIVADWSDVVPRLSACVAMLANA